MTFLLLMALCEMASASQAPSTVAEQFGAGRAGRKSWAHFQTYAPQNREYFLDIGSMWENRNMYWVGGLMGFHLGRCVFSKSQTCQQFFDGVIGIAGSDGLTTGVALAGLRWQFVNFPDAFSPSVSIYAGLENFHDSIRNKEAFTYGLGYGLTTAVHERMDLKFEVRVGYGHDEAIWSQAFVSLGLKLDKWVDYFAEKLKGLGEGTAEVTGKAIKKTFETSVDVVDTVVTQPIKKAVETTGEALGVKEKQENKDKPEEEESSEPPAASESP
ncbi:MAG: hypothetical protein H6624_19350 [Bdellovibrionaceae bacterium]|nr:hypothetical protein [Bdellovibrionales bacterium]MCB9086506.1 hypothetical protein [Pseudobdellovibrionaceae bacterium]